MLALGWFGELLYNIHYKPIQFSFIHLQANRLRWVQGRLTSIRCPLTQLLSVINHTQLLLFLQKKEIYSLLLPISLHPFSFYPLPSSSTITAHHHLLLLPHSSPTTLLPHSSPTFLTERMNISNQTK